MNDRTKLEIAALNFRRAAKLRERGEAITPEFAATLAAVAAKHGETIADALTAAGATPAQPAES